MSPLPYKHSGAIYWQDSALSVPFPSRRGPYRDFFGPHYRILVPEPAPRRGVGKLPGLQRNVLAPLGEAASEETCSLVQQQAEEEERTPL